MKLLLRIILSAILAIVLIFVSAACAVANDTTFTDGAVTILLGVVATLLAIEFTKGSD